MKRLFRATLPVVILAVLATCGSGRVLAGCSRCGSPVLPYFTAPLHPDFGFGAYEHGGRYVLDRELPGWGGYGQGWWGWGGFDGRKLIFPPPNRANIFPYGGFTFYDGEMCSCIESHSDYSRMNWLLPPAMSAQMVLEKLRELNVPLVSPEPQFLNRNPRIADGIRLPVPRPKMKDKDPGD
jgi:hypothetical protein